MSYYLGENRLLKILNEIAFWRKQENEHIIIIKAVLISLERFYKGKLSQFHTMFMKTQGKIDILIKKAVILNGKINDELNKEVIEFIGKVNKESQDFIELISSINNNSQNVIGYIAAQTVLKHLIHESEYFINMCEQVVATNVLFKE